VSRKKTLHVYSNCHSTRSPRRILKFLMISSHRNRSYYYTSSLSPSPTLKAHFFLDKKKKKKLALSFTFSASKHTTSRERKVLKMWTHPYRKNDVEVGARPLYPMMLESPQLRWAFIRKVYSILAFQLLLTIAVAAVVVSVRPIAVFFSTTVAGLGVYILLILMPLFSKFLKPIPCCKFITVRW